MFFLFFLFISLLVFSISFLLNFKSLCTMNMNSPFECGFEPFSKSRSPFSLHFFKLCLIFIFFDIEIIIIFPLPFIFSLNFFFLISFLIILSIILLGLLFEWNQNSLNWN
uniref:NADH dehydrogenase subunit 3 n=1 Tax=Cosmolaelaps hrdyi TaxID=3126097 RepID=UPI0030DF7534